MWNSFNFQGVGVGVGVGIGISGGIGIGVGLGVISGDGDSVGLGDGDGLAVGDIFGVGVAANAADPVETAFLPARPAAVKIPISTNRLTPRVKLIFFNINVPPSYVA